jgi:hypothetical protein
MDTNMGTERRAISSSSTSGGEGLRCAQLASIARLSGQENAHVEEVALLLIEAAIGSCIRCVVDAA